MPSRLMLTACVVILMTARAEAALVTFVAEGPVTSVAPELAGTFSPGDTFTFEWSVDTTTPDTGPSPIFGSYPGALVAASITVESYRAAATVGDVYVTNDEPTAEGFFDAYDVQALDLTGPSVGGLPLDPVALLHFETNGPGTPLDSDDLAVTPTELQSFAVATQQICFLGEPSPKCVLASVDSVRGGGPKAVPAMSAQGTVFLTLALMALALHLRGHARGG